MRCQRPIGIAVGSVTEFSSLTSMSAKSVGVTAPTVHPTISYNVRAIGTRRTCDRVEVCLVQIKKTFVVRFCAGCKCLCLLLVYAVCMLITLLL